MSDTGTRLADALHAQADAIAPTTAAVQSAVFQIDLNATQSRVHQHRAGVLISALAIAAAVVAVSAVTWTHGSQSSSTHAAAPSHATAAPSSPYGLKPGQYRRIVIGTEFWTRIWIPADPTAQWRLQLSGSDGNGNPVDQRGTCGQFAWIPDAERYTPACDPAKWDVDAATLRKQFTPTYPGLTASQRIDETFANGVGVIDAGWAPDAVAQRIEQALLGLPGVTVTHRFSDGAGRTGDLISRTHRIKSSMYFESEGIVVDPHSGRVLATYTKLPTETFTVDPKTGRPLGQPKVIEGSTTLTPIQYSVVDSITG